MSVGLGAGARLLAVSPQLTSRRRGGKLLLLSVISSHRASSAVDQYQPNCTVLDVTAEWSEAADNMFVCLVCTV